MYKTYQIQNRKVGSKKMPTVSGQGEVDSIKDYHLLESQCLMVRQTIINSQYNGTTDYNQYTDFTGKNQSTHKLGYNDVLIN